MSVTNKMVGKVGMKDIKVSVVVPVFNTEKYLADCLKSLVNQTLKEIEIIVVIDEANPDDAELIAREYEAKYPEKVIVLEGPAGRVGDNRNFGMEYASGEFVAFVDSDDYVTSEMYEKMYHKAKSQAADIVVCGFCRVFYNENKIKNIGVGKKGGNVRKDPQILQRAEVFPWNKLFCLDFLKNNQFKFPSLKGFEDSACMYNIMLCANRIAFVNEPLYVYRWQRVGFSTHAIDARIFDAIEASRMTCDFFKAQGAYDICHKVLEKFCFDRLFYRFD